MQVVFIVISESNISLNKMKVFNREPDARNYQFELKKVGGDNNVIVYQREVIE